MIFSWRTLGVVLLLGQIGLSSAASGAILVRATGSATAKAPHEKQVEAATLAGTGLAPGTFLTTGEDGEIVLDLAPGITATMRPKTQVTIEATRENAATDALGNPMPELHITLSVGTVVLNTTAEGLGLEEGTAGGLEGYSKDSDKGGPRRGSGLVVNTPRGGISPVLPGESTITVTGLDPDMASVTIDAIDGSMMAIDNEGRQIPVGSGLVVILRPDFKFPLTPIPQVNQPSSAPTPTPAPPPSASGGAKPAPTPVPTPPPISP